MSTTNGNLKNLKVTDPQGNVYVLVPVDAEARQAIEEAKELSFDEDYFTVEETDTEVHFGLNGVPIGADDTTPLKIIQDDQEGFVLGADTLFTSSLIGSAFTDFSSASTYDVDQKVVHDSKLYNCTTAVSIAGVWNDANWTEIPLIDLANQYTLSAIQDLATKEYVDSLVVSSVSAAASISYVSANYVNNTTFNAYSTDVANQLATLSADKLDKSYSATVNSLLDDKLNVSAFNAYSADVNEILITVDDKLDKTDFDTYSAAVDSQIANKLDTSAFDAYSATVDDRFDDKLDVSAMSAFDVEAYSGSDNVSVQDHIISIQNSKNLIGDGTSIAVVETDAAFVVSATKDFADKTYVTSAVSGKLDKTDFDAYSATVANQFNAKLDTSAFESYSADIDSQISDKLDKSEFDTYSADIDSQISDKLNTSDFNTYSAAVDSQFDTKLDVSAVSSFDVIEYSGSDNVSVQDHIISLQNTKNLIGDGTSITVLETDSAFVVSATKDFADKIFVTSAVSGKLDKTDFDTYSATVDSQLSDKLNTSAFDAYSANVETQLSDKLDISDFNTYSADIVSQFDTKLDVSAVSAFDVEAYSGSDNVFVQDHVISIQNSKNLVGDGTAITVVETVAAFVISATKDFADKTFVTSAVSGKLDKTDFDAYSATVANQFTTKLDTSDFDTYSAAIDNQFDTKLDVSAVSSFDVESYSGSDNISVQDHIISIQHSKNLIGDGTSIAVVETTSAVVVSATKDFADKTYVDTAIASVDVTSAISAKIDGIASPANLGGYAAPTKIMVVSAMPATADIDPTTIYFVVGTMTGN